MRPVLSKLIFSILAIRDGVAPPTINPHTPDPDCDLDYVPNTARQLTVEAALSNSFGFGGTNGSLIFRRFKALDRSTPRGRPRAPPDKVAVPGTALRSLAATEPERWPVFLDSAAEGPLTRYSLLMAEPSATAGA